MDIDGLAKKVKTAQQQFAQPAHDDITTKKILCMLWEILGYNMIYSKYILQ